MILDEKAGNTINIYVRTFCENEMQMLRVVCKIFFTFFNQNINGEYYKDRIFCREFYIRKRKRISRTVDIMSRISNMRLFRRGEGGVVVSKGIKNGRHKV
jgi:hypothetical protein